MDRERQELLRKMLEQVDPDASSDGLRESLENARSDSSLESLESARMANAESQMAIESLDVLHRGGEIEADQQVALEAIVMPFHRPVIDIIDDKISLTQLSTKWQHLGVGDTRKRIEKKILSIGRLELPGNTTIPYAGTGFVAGKLDGGRSLLMTNRHVANLFAQGLGQKNLRFVSGQDVNIDFKKEFNSTASDSLRVQRVVMIHPYWDMALLEVTGLSEEREPLRLVTDDPAGMTDKEVVVVGYPGFNPNPDRVFQQTQARIFRDQYFVKRIQPGLLRKREAVESFKRQVDAVTHDCSTLGGNSGSAVIDVATGDVIALHFAGAYLRANYAVPTHDLAEDSRVVDAGVNFSKQIRTEDRFYAPFWTAADVESPNANGEEKESEVNPTKPVTNATISNGNGVSFQVPLTVTVSIGTPIGAGLSASVASEGLFGRNDDPPPLTDTFSLGSLSNSGFDWATALSLADASRLVYDDKPKVESEAKRRMGFDQCDFLEAADTQCFVAMSSDTALVAFRGTESLRDWLSDLNITSTDRSYGKLHSGFFNAFEVVRPKLTAALSGIGSRAVVLTGHSLGAALATVAAAEWANEFPIRSIYTYGQPATGKGRFASFFRREFGDKMFRFVNDDDIVTRVPPTFDHVGQLRHLGPNGQLKAIQESLNMTTASPVMSQAEFDLMRAQFLQQRAREAQQLQTESAGPVVTEGFLPSFSDHSIDNYIAKIAKHV